MMHYTHTPGGILAVAGYFLLLPPKSPLELMGGLALGAVGGLLPDIDTATSKISQKLGLVSFVVGKVTRHRGITHTVFLWLLLWGGMSVALPEFVTFWVCGLIGCLSHIFLDALTPSGVPILWPFHKKKIHFMKIHTGGRIESLLSAVIWIAVVYSVAILGKTYLDL